MSETLVGINGFGRIGRIVFRNACVPHHRLLLESAATEELSLMSQQQCRARRREGRCCQ